MPNYVNVMALQFEFHPDARVELMEQIEYVQLKFGQRDSEKAFQKVMDGVSQLCDYPKSGALLQDIAYNGCEVRILHLHQLSVVYTYDDKKLYVVCVWNNYKNPERLSGIIGC